VFGNRASTAYRVEFKNDWSATSALSVRPHDVYGDFRSVVLISRIQGRDIGYGFMCECSCMPRGSTLWP
jgi:hypothetical protein